MKVIPQVIMTMKGNFAPFTDLKVGNVNYKGEKFLTKYEVKRTRMFQIQLEGKDAIVATLWWFSRHPTFFKSCAC